MNYGLKSRQSGRNIFTVFLKAGFLVLFFILISLLIPSLLPEQLFTVVTPVWNVGQTLTSEVVSNTGLLRSKKSLIIENQTLRNTLYENKVKQIALQTLQEENESLKEYLGHSSLEASILAGVLASPPRIAYDTLIIDSGIEEGIREGDVVFGYDTIALGTVIEVFDHQAKVELYSSPGKKTPAFISRTGGSVELIGRGGGDFEALLPKEISIVEGDIFVTAGVSGFVLAEAQVVDSKPTDSFREVLAKNSLNMGELRWVTIKR